MAPLAYLPNPLLASALAIVAGEFGTELGEPSFIVLPHESKIYLLHFPPRVVNILTILKREAMMNSKSRNLLIPALIAVTAIVCNKASAAQKMIVDFLVHDPSIIVDPGDDNFSGYSGIANEGRTVTNVHAGDVITLDIVGGAHGNDTSTTNDFVALTEFSASSSKGGLLGNLEQSFGNPTYLFHTGVPGSTNNYADLDGDGDKKLGWADNQHNSGYVFFGTLATASTLNSRLFANAGLTTIDSVEYRLLFLGQLSFTIMPGQDFSSQLSTRVAPLLFRDGSSVGANGTIFTQQAYFDTTVAATARMYGTDPRLVLGRGVTITSAVPDSPVPEPSCLAAIPLIGLLAQRRGKR